MTTLSAPTPQRPAAVVAGLLYAGSAAGFIAVFVWLAGAFGYPDVLKAGAADVLPRLWALGATGRAVWTIYALLPLALIPAALGARATLGTHGARRMRAATALQLVAAVAMTTGLARWPSLNWGLARDWRSATAEQQQALAATFDVGNRYLGNVVGEFVGEVALYAAIALMGSVLLSAWRTRSASAGARWVGWLAVVTGVVGEVAAWRNVTSAVEPAAQLANNLLPASLIALGVVLMRWRATRVSERAEVAALAAAPRRDAAGRVARGVAVAVIAGLGLVMVAGGAFVTSA